MKKVISVIALLAVSITYAQTTGIGTPTPDPDAALEVSATNKGLLLPRIALVATANAAPLSAHKQGMLVYNTATAADVTPGYYYNDGAQWVRVASGGVDNNTTVTSLTEDGTDLILTDSDNNTVSIPLADIAPPQTNTTLGLNNASGQLTYNNENSDNPTVDLTAIEPWFGTDNNAGATENTEDIYTLGNVGVGTNNPNANLEIEGSDGDKIKISDFEFEKYDANAVPSSYGFNLLTTGTSSEHLFIRNSQGSNEQIFLFGDGVSGSNHNVFGVSTTTDDGVTWNPHFVVNQGGNVGIGTATPNEKLEVNGKVRISDLTGTDAATDVIVTADPVTGELKEGGLVSALSGGTADGDAWAVTGEDQTSAIGRTGNVGIGTATPTQLLEVSDEALIDGMRVGVGGPSSTVGNTAVGGNTLNANTGPFNTAIGNNALTANTSGENNVAVGALALEANTIGFSNVALGFAALFRNQTGTGNVAVGESTLQANTSGVNNVAVGLSALNSNQTGSRNIAIGRAGADVTIGSDNIFIGHQAGNGIVSGSGNTIIGGPRIPLPANTTNNIIIGDGDNNERIRVLANGNTGIGTSTPNERLEVNGKVRISDLTGADAATDVIVTADPVTGELKEGGLVSALGGSNNDIYTADGTLAGNRNVALNSNNLTFSATGTEEVVVDANVRLGGALYGNIRTHALATPIVWAPDDFAIIVTNLGIQGLLELPQPASAHAGRIVSIRNNSGGALFFEPSTAPPNKTSIAGGSGFLFMSDGVDWHPIGSR